ncbi:hypothetical protein O95_00326, partial [Bartonella henselae JK 53]
SPQTKAKRLAVFTTGDKAIMGLFGRSRDVRTPVVPEAV